MKGWCICLFITFSLYVSANGQQTTFALPSANSKLPKIANTRLLMDSSLTAGNFFVRNFPNPLITPIPSKYYESTLGFFCKKELQLEKAIKFPLKFRLGSVSYTDKMEGKSN